MLKNAINKRILFMISHYLIHKRWHSYMSVHVRWYAVKLVKLFQKQLKRNLKSSTKKQITEIDF